MKNRFSSLVSQCYLNPPAEDNFEITVFGPGVGESTLVHIPSVGWGIVDSCKFRCGEEEIIPALDYLYSLYTTPPPLAFIALTHPHRDHYEGLDRIINEYPNTIERVCRYEGHGIPELKYYVAAHASYEMKVPYYASVQNAFKSAIDRGADLKFLGENKVVLQRDIPEKRRSIRITSLSPSASGVDMYAEALQKLFGDKNTRIESIKAKDANLISSALLIEFNDLSIIIGGDVERGDSDSGWVRIAHNQDMPSIRANAIKVSHHGANSAYYEEAWVKHASGSFPYALIAPYHTCVTPLPTRKDVTNLKRHACVGLTVQAPVSAKPKDYYSKPIASGLQDLCEQFIPISNHKRLGLLRLRFNEDGSILSAEAIPPASWL